MKKVYITRRIPEAGIKLLQKQKGFKVEVSPHDRVLSKKEIIKKAKGCDALLSLLTDKIDGDILDGIGKQLKIVANYAVGFNNLDVKAAKKRKVMMSNAPGPEISQSVAEHAFGLLLSVAKRIPESDKYTRAGKYKGWAPMLFLGVDVHDKVLGIVGLGAIGRAVAHRAVKGMGMKVLYYDLKRDKAFEKKYGAKHASVKELLKKSDFVTLHVPLLPSTKHLIGAKELNSMKKTAFLINTSRGPVIDEKALVKALRAKKIAGAGLDVYEWEPKLAPGLAKLPNAVLTPHTASASIETRSAMSVTAAKNIIAALTGKKPPNLIK
ncbi:MAG: D-glycerate dehydrogenase [Patescibacteria group bacterium]|nr:D-glycerate dehydrogenase [Patescibacteria group bacterium]